MTVREFMEAFTPVVCVVCALVAAIAGIGAWGWFLVIAVLAAAA